MAKNRKKKKKEEYNEDDLIIIDEPEAIAPNPNLAELTDEEFYSTPGVKEYLER